jgi:ABC-type polysaccharide/polyol phosphate transport system ATPase subunit
VATKGRFAHAKSSVGDAYDDAVVVAEGVSKRYPGIALPLFAPMYSMFQRRPFRRKRPVAYDETQDATENGDRGSRSRSDKGKRRRDEDYRDDEYLNEEDDLDEGDDEDDDFADDEEWVPQHPQRDAPFWALKDVSFRVGPGRGLAVVGPKESGKTTLLRIISGGATPTEGRVLVRDPVSRLPADLAKGLSVTTKGTFGFHLILGSQMLGIPAPLVKRHREEIEELARPQPNHEGDPDPASIIRLAVAMTVVLPSSVILLEDPLARGDDPLAEDFAERMIPRIHDRLRSGSSLVLASRSMELAQELCDEAILLNEGSIVDRGVPRDLGGRSAALQGKGKKATREPKSAKLVGPSQHLSPEPEIRVPPVVPSFNAAAALHSATLSTTSGRSKEIDATADEVTVEIRFGTALPDVEAHCGVGFTPRSGDGAGIRLEPPEPLRFVSPRTYVLAARIPPGTLPCGVYEVRADAVVANPDEREASVIATNVGRVRVVGDEPDVPEPDHSPAPHWDGSLSWRAEVEWSVE